MRLADFILANREQILAEWETFARTCVPASGTMDVAGLSDHQGNSAFGKPDHTWS